jgi:hypothetical protein
MQDEWGYRAAARTAFRRTVDLRLALLDPLDGAQRVGRVPVRAECRGRAGDPGGRYQLTRRFVADAGGTIVSFRTYTCTSSGCTVPPSTPFVKVMPEGRPEKSGRAGPDVPAGIGSENDFALVVDVFTTMTYGRPWYIQ